MARFEIVQTSGGQYRNEIIRLWDECLTGTVPARFDWMQSGNPAGEAIWFLALEAGTERLSGAISFMPKVMRTRERVLKAGILGDFMVDKKHRTFGPGLLLAKTAISRASSMGFDLIYTVPNTNSKKIVESNGLQAQSVVCHFVKPLSVRRYLRKYTGDIAANFISPVFDFFLSLASRETYSSSAATREEFAIDSSFDALWSRILSRSEYLMGDRCSAYLEWRYLSNPQSKFRLLTCRESGTGDLSGYLFFTMGDNAVAIYDIIAGDKRSFFALMKMLVRVAKAERCHSIYVRIHEHTPFLSWLHRCLFVDAKDNIPILSCSTGIITEEWHFTDGDRNL